MTDLDWRTYATDNGKPTALKAVQADRVSWRVDVVPVQMAGILSVTVKGGPAFILAEIAEVPGTDVVDELKSIAELYAGDPAAFAQMLKTHEAQMKAVIRSWREAQS